MRSLLVEGSCPSEGKGSQVLFSLSMEQSQNMSDLMRYEHAKSEICYRFS